MGLIIENFKMAMSSVKANKMRSFLTMLGIIIGIASVIAITAVGEGTKTAVNKAIDGYGKNRVIIMMNYKSNEEPDIGKYFSFEDIKLIKEKFGKRIVYISPWAKTQNTIKKNKKEEKVNLEFVDYNYMKELTKDIIIKGRDFNESDVKQRKNFAIVNEVFAKNLFGKEDVIGEQIDANVNGESKILKIIGVYKREKTLFDALEGSNSTDLYLPYTLLDRAFISTLDIKVDISLNSKTESERLLKFVSRQKRVSKNSYIVHTLDEQTEQINNILGTLSLGLGVIAGISLLVGGIGIMNIMLVSVTERTREIGIRKSLGARKKDILTQFLVESIMLSGAGGAIGTVIGIILSNLITGIMQVKPTIPVQSIIIAVAFSFIVGIFFGLYPAYKASSLDPIDALRYE